ncbi:amidohydrolase [Alkaliphilus sp. MSJ-5]|uniref:Amidohydrolase n=1 Tax=Alkaliphilus flagellatus TaxID=2841507 RepID=A0ABS6FXG4_9FIRM|nr:amidohydrolase [Alkaliphilus flagellatus]MBU5674930.1 amidohydrolase [Alkaliphilus flagellatus]
MSGKLLKNALTININDGKVYKKDILVINGKIKRVEKDILLDEDDIEIIDVKENYVLPGMIDCHTHLGIIEEATGKIGIDNNEISEPVTPQLRGIDAINPMDIAFWDAVKSGVTSVMSGPGSNNAVGGLSAAIKTHGTIIDRMILRNPVGLKIALGENPISTYGIDKKSPVTRMGTAYLIRDLFMRAQDYMDLKERNKIIQRDIKLEAIIPVLTGQISLRAHAHRADDIVTAIRIAEEFGINKLVIEHGTEANIIKDYLKEKKVAVALGPMLTPRIKMELKKRNYYSAIELVEAGIKVALITDHPYNSIDQLRTITILAMAEGLSVQDALKCITIHPAEILECDNKIGKIEKGYDADLAIYSGHPFNINTRVNMTMINGDIVFKA